MTYFCEGISNFQLAKQNAVINYENKTLENTMNPKTINIIRWIARMWASLMAAIILFVFVGDAVGDGNGPAVALTIRDYLMIPSFLIVFLGLILAWKREKLGGWMIIAGMAAFYLFAFAYSGDFPQGPFFLIIATPGILFLICAYAKIKTD
jgi:hypothetical protein